MSTPSAPKPVRLFCGILAADAKALDAAHRELALLFGPIDLASDIVPFTFTDYYTPEMGPALLRQFVAFEKLIDPGRLAAAKVQTNALEERYIRERPGGIRGRALNLDPGLVSPASVVMATGKNSSQRIYLRDGIYAELTLQFRRDGIVTFDWTYPDFRSAFCQAFLLAVRGRLPSIGRSSASVSK